MYYIIIFFTVLFSFFMGSIPTGYLLVKQTVGVDIRTQGSGNIGSTNVKRIAGGKVAALTQAFDVLKGVIPVAVAIFTANSFELPVSKDLLVSITALAAVAGHCYTPFLGFNGGKGVNTTLGAFLLVATIPVIIGLTIYILMKFFIKTVSVKSIAAAASLPITAFIVRLPITVTIAIILVAALMVFRHKDNIRRLAIGTEK